MEKQLNKKVPAIRFKGFEEEWIRAPVGTYYNFKNGLNKGKEYFGFGTPIVNFTDVYKNRSLVFDDLKGRVSLTVDEISNYNVKKGDVFFTRTSEIIEEIGYPSVMENEPVNTVFSGFVLRARAKDVDPLAMAFKRYSFFTKSFRSEMMMKSSMTTRALTSGSAIKKMYFCFPDSKGEQTKIGGYFKTLDQTLTLHQRKYDKLISLKKSMLQKMFPQNGTTTPEVRFKGFSRGWVTRKLMDFSGKVTEKNLSKLYKDTFTNSAEFGVINQRDYFEKEISNIDNIGGYYIVRPDDFVYNPRVSTFAPCGPINRNKLKKIGVISPLYTVFRVRGVDSNFLEYFFKTRLWYPFMFYNGDTGARADRFSIKDSVFFDLPVLLPLDMDEQEKIGAYFQRLDQLINQHATQLEKLKQIKAACLERMFV